jgi:hypothetical protein
MRCSSHSCPHVSQRKTTVITPCAAVALTGMPTLVVQRGQDGLSRKSALSTDCEERRPLCQTGAQNVIGENPYRADFLGRPGFIGQNDGYLCTHELRTKPVDDAAVGCWVRSGVDLCGQTEGFLCGSAGCSCRAAIGPGNAGNRCAGQSTGGDTWDSGRYSVTLTTPPALTSMGTPTPFRHCGHEGVSLGLALGSGTGRGYATVTSRNGAINQGKPLPYS